MVLSELDRPEDGSPPSTDDYSTSTTEAPQSFNFNHANGPPAIVSLAPYTGLLLSEYELRLLLTGLSKATADLLRRPATQVEAEAVTQYASEIEYQRRIGIAIGGTAGIGLCAAGSKNTFPLPGIHRLMADGQSFGLLRGKQAMFMWQALRLMSWTLTGVIGGSVAAQTWAMVYLTPRYFRDERLSAVLEAIKKRAGQRAIERENRRKEAQIQKSQTPGPMAGETVEMARQRARVTGAWSRDEGKQSSGSNQDDDMSPTGGAFSQEYLDTGSSHEMLSDAEVKRQYASSSVQNSSDDVFPASSASTRTNTPQSSSPASRSTSTSSSSSSQPSPVEASSSGSGSAWDRLRQKALSGTGQQQASVSTFSPSPRGGNGHDEYSFTSSENDQQAQARAEAQREFDARLEQERHGKDFDERGSGGASGRRGW